MTVDTGTAGTYGPFVESAVIETWALRRDEVAAVACERTEAHAPHEGAAELFDGGASHGYVPAACPGTHHTVRLTHAARVALAYRLSSVSFTRGTRTTPPPVPEADGYHHVRLSYHARAVVAGKLAPDGDQPGQVWHNGIFTTDQVWEEIAAAFPRSLARAGRGCQRELAAAFPPVWFTDWADEHPHDPDADRLVHYYLPTFGR